ncbi:MAG: 4Fe-4S binding protein [Clostridia bacterium]|nr:4Fe-4S binding protein [Clostridia bacterium]
MKRQPFRKAILFISFLLFPITIFYLSPYLIIDGAFQGIVTGSFIMFIVLFVSSLFFGRLFCSWFCPAGGLQECCRMVTDKKAKLGKRDYIKYVIWVPWLLSIAAGFIAAGGVKQWDFFYQTEHGISISSPLKYIIYYGCIIVIAFLALKSGRRAACHYICWMSPFMILGSKIKNTLKYPSLHLKADGGKCTGCKLCTKICPMSLEVDQMVKQNDMNHPECILCGECVDQCSKGAVKYALKVHKK